MTLAGLAQCVRRVSLLQWQLLTFVLLGGLWVLAPLRSAPLPPAGLVADAGEGAPVRKEPQAQDWELLLRIIGQRELFRPPLPTTTAESAAMTARKMLQNLSLVGIVSEGGKAKAWIAEKEGGLALYGEGDHVGPFTVKSIASGTVELEVSGQVVELRR